MSLSIDASNVNSYITNASAVNVKVDATTSKTLQAAIMAGEVIGKVEKGAFHFAHVTSLPNTGVGYSWLCPVQESGGIYTLVL